MKLFDFLVVFFDNLFSRVTELGLLLFSVDYLLKSFFAATGFVHSLWVATFVIILLTSLLHGVFEERNG